MMRLLRLLRRLFGQKRHAWVEIETVEEDFRLPITLSRCRWCGFLREQEGAGRDPLRDFQYASPENPDKFSSVMHWDYEGGPYRCQ